MLKGRVLTIRFISLHIVMNVCWNEMNKVTYQTRAIDILLESNCCRTNFLLTGFLSMTGGYV